MQAAQAVGAQPEEFVKNICFVDASGRLVVAIVRGQGRASSARVGKVLKISAPRPATPDEVTALRGFRAAGCRRLALKPSIS